MAQVGAAQPFLLEQLLAEIAPWLQLLTDLRNSLNPPKRRKIKLLGGRNISIHTSSIALISETEYYVQRLPPILSPKVQGKNIF